VKTPEEIEELRAQSQALKAEKEAKRAAKKAKFGAQNADKNLPVVEVRVPWVTSEGREINLEKPPWDSLCDAYTHLWKVENGNRPCRVRVVRT
jgi:hypothetical protein